MFLKREIIDEFIGAGINKFIFIGENILNFHGSDDSYYEELNEDLEDGWAVFLHFLPHVQLEMESYRLHDWIPFMDENDKTFGWRTKRPELLFRAIDSEMSDNVEVLLSS